MNTQPSLTIASSVLALALFGIAIAPAASAQQATAGSGMDPAFQTMDQNHDGRLSRSEIPSDMVLLRTRFSTYDSNQDNQLDAQEFAAAKVATQGKGHAMGGDSTPPPQQHESHP